MNITIENFDIILKDFGVTTAEDLLKKRTSEKQTKPAEIIEPPRLVPMTADQCKRMCDKVKLDYHPGYEKRVIERITTTEAPDRYGDIVRAKGANIESYKKNPVVMFAHNHSDAPIGKSIKLWMDSPTKSWRSQDLHFGDELDASGYYEYLFKMVASGAMPGGSIGFMPNEVKSDHTPTEREMLGLGRFGVEYLGWDYLEHSACSIPANPEALANSLRAIGKPKLRGFFAPADLTRMESLKMFDGNILDAFALALGIEKTIVDVSVTKGVIPYAEHSKDPEKEPWDAGTEIKKADVKDLKVMCTWYDSANEETKTAYKLPHHRASGYHTVWNGVKAAMGALLGARGGVDIPEGDKKACYNHLAKHYKDFSKEPPEMKSYTDEELLSMDYEIELKDLEAVDAEKSAASLIADFTNVPDSFKKLIAEQEKQVVVNLTIAGFDAFMKRMDEIESKMVALDERFKSFSSAKPAGGNDDDPGIALHSEIAKATQNIFSKG